MCTATVGGGAYWAGPPTSCAQRASTVACPLPYHFSASKLNFLSFRIEHMKAVNANIAMSSLKPWKTSIFPQKSVVPFRRRSPNLQQGLCPWTPLGHGPQTYSCPPTLNDFPPPMPAIKNGCLAHTSLSCKQHLVPSSGVERVIIHQC